MGDEEKQKMKEQNQPTTPAKQERILKQGKSPSTRQRIFNPLAAGLTFGSTFLGAAQGPRAAEQKMATDQAARNSLRNRPEMVLPTQMEQEVQIASSIAIEHFEVAREPIQNMIDGIRTENQNNQDVLDLLDSGVENGQIIFGVEDFSEAGAAETARLFGLDGNQEVVNRLEAIHQNLEILNQTRVNVQLRTNIFFDAGTPTDLSLYLTVISEGGLTTPNGETLPQGSIVAFNEGATDRMSVYPAVARGRILEFRADTVIGERTLEQALESSMGREFDVPEEAPYFLFEIDENNNIVQFFYQSVDGQTRTVALMREDPYVQLATRTPAPGEEGKEAVILVKARSGGAENPAETSSLSAVFGPEISQGVELSYSTDSIRVFSDLQDNTTIVPMREPYQSRETAESNADKVLAYQVWAATTAHGNGKFANMNLEQVSQIFKDALNGNFGNYTREDFAVTLPYVLGLNGTEHPNYQVNLLDAMPRANIIFTDQQEGEFKDLHQKMAVVVNVEGLHMRAGIVELVNGELGLIINVGNSATIARTDDWFAYANVLATSLGLFETGANTWSSDTEFQPAHREILAGFMVPEEYIFLISDVHRTELEGQ